MQVKEQFLVKGRDQDHIGLHARAQTLERGQRCRAIFLGAGERFLECMIARENSRRAGDPLIIFLDQLLKNPGAVAKTVIDLRERVLPVSLPNDQISRALHEREQREKREQEPTAKTAEFQRYPPLESAGVRWTRKSGLRSSVKDNSFDPARSTCCADLSGEPFSDGCQTCTV